METALTIVIAAVTKAAAFLPFASFVVQWLFLLVFFFFILG